MKKLHLGCGQRYFEGYVNIDYPLSEHSVMQDAVADEFANLFELTYPAGTIGEVRLHHVFEHFSRANACALLASWNSWLPIGGTIHIEVPDFKRTAWNVLNPFTSKKIKFTALRHIFGSQEAHWAIHFDGYSKNNLKLMLEIFGFSVKEFRYNSWMGTHNIEVIGEKRTDLTKETALAAANEYLRNFMVSDVSSEQIQLTTWLNDFRTQLDKTFAGTIA